MRVLDDDSELLSEIIDLLLMESTKQLSELSRIQAEGNLPELANTAHAIKGEVAYFYAYTAKECARILEQAAHNGQSADFKGMTEAVEMAVRDLMNNLMEAKNSKNHVK